FAGARSRSGRRRCTWGGPRSSSRPRRTTLTAGVSPWSSKPKPSSSRLARVLIAGNWMMFKGPAEAGAFFRGLRDAELADDSDVVVCPPYVSLTAAVQALAGTEIGVFAQNCHWEREGAFTGEISPTMLVELGVYGTIVGHSERRQYFGETDETVGKR